MINRELINPQSIVIVGGSNNVQKPGGRLVRNLLDGKYKGDLYVVNAKETEVTMIKIIKDLDITASGVSVFNRKWQPVHLQQGEMDGACAVYSMMMNLLILKVLTRNQVVNLKTTFKGNTAKGRLFKEFFVTEGLCRDGFYFSEIKEKLSHSFAKEVTSSPLQYTASLSDQTSFVEELRTAIDSDTPLITALSFKGGAHAVLAIGYEENKKTVSRKYSV
jgi:hypothetical protein